MFRPCEPRITSVSPNKKIGHADSSLGSAPVLSCGLPQRKVIFYLKQITSNICALPPWQHHNEHNQFPLWLHCKRIQHWAKLFLNLSLLFLWNGSKLGINVAQEQQELQQWPQLWNVTEQLKLAVPFSCTSTSSSSLMFSFHWGMSTCRE